MKGLVCYESEFGNTHVIAEAIARGLRRAIDARAIPIDAATADVLKDVDLLVIGGPTHMHGLSRVGTRQAAWEQAHEQPGLTLDPDAATEGIRAWFDAQPASTSLAAAFDTRVEGRALLTGRASKAISKRLRQHGFDEVVEPESFLVTQDEHLVAGEEDRAEQWGERLIYLAKVAALGKF